MKYFFFGFIFQFSVFGFCFPTAFFIFHGRFRCIKSEKCFANCLRCAIVLANEPVSSNMSWSSEHISARYICKLLSLHFRSLVAGAAFILILMPRKSIVSERSFFSHCLVSIDASHRMPKTSSIFVFLFFAEICEHAQPNCSNSFRFRQLIPNN